MSRKTRRARLRRQAAQTAREVRLQAAGTPPLTAYWEARYAAGGDSGVGSAGDAAERKAAYVNAVIRREGVTSVVDWGCGDGRQLELLELPAAYLGVDISATAVARCVRRHPSKSFLFWPASGPEVTVRADLALSLDVLFHLVRDEDFAAYRGRLFASAQRIVLAHTTDVDLTDTARHVRHRRITDHVPGGWSLASRPDDPTVPGFYLWRRA